MARFLKKRGLTKGARPGSLILLGDQQTDRVHIHVMQYDEHSLEEKDVDSITEALSMIAGEKLTWINVFGIHDPAVISLIGKELGLDNLLLEDIMNTGHRPGFRQTEDHLFIIAKLLSYHPDNKQIAADQLSLVAGENYVITLQEKPGSHFEVVRNRIRGSKNRMYIHRPDYLAYALLDCVVDAYMDMIAEIGNSIDELEKEILGEPGKETARKIYRHRTELNYLRQIVLPFKELVMAFSKTGSTIVRQETREYIKDLYDHLIITHESVELYYSIVADQLEIYNAHISNKANEIMKVLTVFAAIFIPLTFIAGIYGMNFKYIPELEWENGYLYFWGMIVVIGLLLGLYFKRKKWL